MGTNAEEVVGDQRVCKCDLRTKLVGDGCSVCNPDLARDLSEQPPDTQYEPFGEDGPDSDGFKGPRPWNGFVSIGKTALRSRWNRIANSEDMFEQFVTEVHALIVVLTSTSKEKDNEH